MDLRLPALVARAMVAPVALIVVVLGSILIGLATATEAAAVGAVGAVLLAALRGQGAHVPVALCLAAFAALMALRAAFDTRAAFGLTLGVLLMAVLAFGLALALRAVWRAGYLTATATKTTQMTSMIFTILIGATLFSLVFRGLGGDDMVHRALSNLPGGAAGAILAVMLAMFLLGFVMDAFEIIFVVVPIVAPPLLAMPGRRAGLARHHDGDESADLLHAPAARADAVLPARRRAARDHHPAHLCRYHPVRADPALRAGRALVCAGTCDLAAADAVWRVMQ
jgi:TRAP-type C4-dicarboxylate transport system permease large subunit